MDSRDFSLPIGLFPIVVRFGEEPHILYTGDLCVKWSEPQGQTDMPMLIIDWCYSIALTHSQTLRGSGGWVRCRFWFISGRERYL